MGCVGGRVTSWSLARIGTNMHRRMSAAVRSAGVLALPSDWLQWASSEGATSGLRVESSDNLT